MFLLAWKATKIKHMKILTAKKKKKAINFNCVGA